MATLALPRAHRRSPREFIWPVGFGLAIPVVFIFYKFFLPDMDQSTQDFVQNWLPLSVVNTSLVWVVMALGLNIVVGYAGLLDLGYVAFWAIGSYVAGETMSGFLGGEYHWTFHLLAPPLQSKQDGIHISFWIVLVIAGAFCGLCGIFIGAPTLRLRSDYLALVTLGFGEIIPQFVKNGDNVGGLNITNGDKSITPVDPIGTGPFAALKGVGQTIGVFDLAYEFLVFALIAVFCVFVSLRIRQGRLGRAWLAIREDELAASMMGVPLVKAKLSAYAVGAVFGGLGGVAWAVAVGGAYPNFGFSNSILILLMVVLGGMGNVWGVMLGALVLAWINDRGLAKFGDAFNNSAGTHFDFVSYNFLIFGIILVLMMLFRREGLLPEARTRQILREPSRTEMESVGADIAEAEALIEVTEEQLEAPSDDEHFPRTDANDNPDGNPS